MRQRLWRWLDEFGWPTDDADDVVMAVHEAVANVTGHAYPDHAPGRFQVTGRMTFLVGCTHAQVDLAVRDWGRWKRPQSDPGYRGHGLPLIRACMRTVDIVRQSDGTEVRMVSNVAPLSPPLLQEPATGTIAIPLGTAARPLRTSHC